MTTFLINHDLIRAVALIAPKTDVRFYLNGLHIVGRQGDDYVRLEATDGGVALVAKAGLLDDGRITDPLDVIVPIELIEQAVKVMKRALHWRITVSASDHETMLPRVAISDEVTTVTALAVEGRYPSLSRLVHGASAPSGEVAQYDPRYLSLMQEAACIALGKAPKKTMMMCITIRIRHNGDKVALVEMSNNNIFGMIMPYRTDEPQGVPAWYAESVATREEEQTA